MTFDPQKILGQADGAVTDETGRQVGYFWENPITKNMTEDERKAYWATRGMTKK